MIDPITQYILEQEKLKEFEIGYVGKYSGRSADFIRSQMNKDPNQLSFVRMKRGEALVAAGVGAGLIALMGFKIFKRYMTKTGKACRDYTSGSLRYKACATNVKIEGRKNQLAYMNSKASMCKDTKDPAKCKTKLQKQIKKVKDDIAKLESKKNEYLALIK